MPIEEDKRITNPILGGNEMKRNTMRMMSNQIPQMPSLGVHNMPVRVPVLGVYNMPIEEDETITNRILGGNETRRYY